MNDRDEAIKALDLIRSNWDGAVGRDDTEAAQLLRAAIDRAYPAGEDQYWLFLEPNPSFEPGRRGEASYEWCWQLERRNESAGTAWLFARGWAQTEETATKQGRETATSHGMSIAREVVRAARDVPMPIRRWSATPPTEPGWYFVCQPGAFQDAPTPVKLVVEQHSAPALYFTHPTDAEGYSHTTAEDGFLWWSEPVQEPPK